MFNFIVGIKKESDYSYKIVKLLWCWRFFSDASDILNMPRNDLLKQFKKCYECMLELGDKKKVEREVEKFKSTWEEFK